ncbi:hypothetical protein GN956_G23789 [Arapaima gigas]
MEALDSERSAVAKRKDYCLPTIWRKGLRPLGKDCSEESCTSEMRRCPGPVGAGSPRARGLRTYAGFIFEPRCLSSTERSQV